ncbi:uncharacterized protein ELE39_002408 [Cryptosporidium sp. chipmunk genotype I]|uniref:uncharacterized protein n=1 Tax=Cryptosporidium sp. chipmunk genotype I TaxID=1280935 RepID=UPI00351A18D0|nr:hypothetical protein ELE39_002408 [Cryptosporidium sp. chipmunk genotype I]
MYSQIPISPSLRSKYNSGNQGGQRKLNVDDMKNTTVGPYSNNMLTTNSDGYGTFDNSNRDSELNRPNFKKSSFPHESFRPSSSNIGVNNRINIDSGSNNKPDMSNFFANSGNLNLNGTSNQIKTNGIPMSTPLPVFPPPPIPFQNNSSISGGLQYHSPKNTRPTQPPNNSQPTNQISKPFLQNSNTNFNFQNISNPYPPKVPFSDFANSDTDSSFNKKMQDNKERLEQLNISRTVLASIGSPSSDYRHSYFQDKSQDVTRTQNPFQNGKNSMSHIGIQEPNSNKNTSRSNPRLPPKAPGISSNTAFKLNISQPAQNNQINFDVPEVSVKNMDNNVERNMIGLKDTIRPPTAPTFFPSNKLNLDNNVSLANNMVKPPVKNQNAPPISQDSFFSSEIQSSSKISQVPHQISSVVRPPTAPNSISKSSSLPKVDLLMNLMDKTVENKRKEFEKLNKLKSALSELGDFNKKLLEENTRLRSGNNSTNLQEVSLLSRDLQNNSMEFTNTYQTPLSDTVSPFIPDTNDPETQISSLKTIINKKNQRILELERKLSAGGSKDLSTKEIDICHSLLQRIKTRDEELNRTFEEIQGSYINSIIDQVNNCLSILTEKNYGKLKTVANDVLNQIEFNYKALSVTLDHLFEQQNSTLENIKHEGRVDTQLDSSNLQSKLNSREFNANEANPNNIQINTVSNSPNRSFDNTFIQENNQGTLKFKESQVIVEYSNGDNEFLATQADNFSDENKNIELNTKINFPQCTASSSIEVSYDETFIQNQQFNLFQNGTFNQEFQDHENDYTQNQGLDAVSAAQEVLINDHATSHPCELHKDEDHPSSTHRVQEDSFPAFGFGQERVHNGHFSQYERSNIFIEKENTQEQGIDYTEDIPPPVFAAYHEGGGSENNDLFAMNPMVNTDGLYFENHSHYQIPANYSNI